MATLLIQGEGSFIPILENLDSNLVWYRLLADEGLLFSFSNDSYLNIPLGGKLPRNTLPSAFHLTSLIFWLFPIFWAYAINFVLVHSMAFFGMSLLLEEIKATKQSLGNPIIALAFAILPFFTLHGAAAIAGLPFIAFCFLRAQKGNLHITLLIALFVASLYGSLVLSGAFILLNLIILLTFNKAWQKKSVITAGALFALGMMLSEINLFISLLDPNFVSHRTEFLHLSEKLSLSEGLVLGVKFFLNGHYHAPSLHFPILVLLVLSSFLWLKKGKSKPVVYALAFLVFSSIVYGYLHSSQSDFIKEGFIGRSFHFMRIAFLNSPVWYILAALLIRLFFDRSSKSLQAIGLICSIIIMLNVFRFNPIFRNNVKLLANESEEVISYEKLISEPIFSEIADTLKAYPNTYVLNIGIFPAVSMLNGIPCLDGYFVNYPLSYKNSFKEVIKKELEKSDGLNSAFTGWGNRCYSYVSQLDECYPRIWQCGVKISQPIATEIDWNKAVGLRAGFVLSSTILLDKELIALKSWPYLDAKLYLYKINL